MEMLGRMTSSVIHDLNNFLTVIQLNAALLEELGNDPEERTRMITEISLACATASELTRNILSFARREPATAAPVHLQRLLNDLTGFLQCLLPRRAKIATDFCEPELWVKGDRAALSQAVMNLALNALDAGGPAEVRISLQATPGEARITVTDFGTGIPSEDLPHIFEPFFTTKPADKGTGLGLMIVRRVVEEHSGKVEVETETGKGTSFQISLPRLAMPDSSPPPSKAPEAAVSARSGKIILLVEDDAGIRRIASQMLQKRGYQTVEAADAAEAAEIWKERGREVSLLFTDVVLPGPLSGEELAAALRRDAPELPVLFTSGNPGSLHTEKVPFIAKPYAPDRLIQKVRELIDEDDSRGES